MVELIGGGGGEEDNKEAKIMTIKGAGERTLFFWPPASDSGSYYSKYDGFTSNQFPNYNPYASTVSNNYYSTSLSAGNQFGLISFLPSFLPSLSFRVYCQIV